MSPGNPNQRWVEALARLEANALLREIKPGSNRETIERGGKTLINLASNNYLGLAHDVRVIEAGKKALEQYGLGSGASRLVSGNCEVVDALERKLAKFKSQEAALVFPSGYQANVGVLTAIAGPRDTLIMDSLNHASLIDGARLSGAKVLKYAHKNMDDLEQILQTATESKSLIHHSVPEQNHSRGARPATRDQIFIVTDGVFSMDGDLAPLPKIVELAKRYGAQIVLDDAHGSGIVGPDGKGTSAHFGLEKEIDIHIGTLSKAFGAQGGFVAGSKILIDWLVNKSRGFIFSTGISPVLAAGAMKALEISVAEPDRRSKLFGHIENLRVGLSKKGYTLSGEPESPMLLVMIGEAERAKSLSALLEDLGILAPAIRPPTVPEGESRIRLVPMATHTPAQILAVIDAFPEVTF